MKTIFYYILASFFLITNVQADTVDRILAKVGNDVITMSDKSEKFKLKKRLLLFNYGKKEGLAKAKKFEQNLLNELILESLLKQEIAKAGIAISDQELQTEYQYRLANLNRSENFFIHELAKYGLTLREYKEDLRFQIAKQRYVQKTIYPKIEVSDKELLQAYNSKKSNFKKYNSFRFIEVALMRDQFSSDQELARMSTLIHKKLESNARDAKTLIKKHSSGGFKDTGGDSGMMAAKDLNPQIRMLLQDLKEGQTSQVFKKEGAHFIFKLIKQANPEPLEFSEVAGLLKNELMQDAVHDELQQHLLAAKDQTYVEVLQ